MNVRLGRYFLLAKANSNIFRLRASEKQPVTGIFEPREYVSSSYSSRKLLPIRNYINNFHSSRTSQQINSSDTLSDLGRSFSVYSQLKQRQQPQQSCKMPRYEIVEKGTPDSQTYRVYFKNNCGKVVSPFHDIPMFANDEKTLYNMVVEIPRWTNAKMEISLTEVFNPIRQDVKKDKLRFVANCFPHKGYIWNYGAIPQTWENPNHVEPTTGCNGDNDPVDAIEIGSRVAKRGDVLKVKVLGVFALIDEGETDWKVVTIDVNDPVAEKLNDIQDIDTYFPGLLRATVEWFRIYKIPDGKPENQFAYSGDGKNAAFAKAILETTHNFWNDLITTPCEGNAISCKNTTHKGNEHYVPVEDAEKILENVPDDGEAEEISESVNRWHYVLLK